MAEGYPTLNLFRALYEGYTLESTDEEIRLKLVETPGGKRELLVQLKSMRSAQYKSFNDSDFEWALLALKDWNKVGENE